MRKNWFNTLNEALDSEGLTKYWPIGINIQYDETKKILIKEGKDQECVIVYRDNKGMYERPIHYKVW